MTASLASTLFPLTLVIAPGIVWAATRRFADGRRLVGTGQLSRNGSHRPAELYALAPGAEGSAN